MKTNKSLPLAIIAVLMLCILAGGAGVYGVYAYRQRLGLALTAATPEVLVTNTPRAASANTSTPPGIPVEVLEPTSVAEPTIGAESTIAADPTQVIPAASNAVCGETVTWNILILGSDLKDTDLLRGSDLTQVMRVDFPNQKVTVYAFPRDLWVDTTGLGLTNPTVNATQLGMVFYEARMRSPQFGMRDVMVDGVRMSAATLLKNFSVISDHYLAIDLNQLPQIIDAIGGIPINVPEQITDLSRPILIKAGQQTLNGAQTVDYSRAFMGTDFARIERNQVLLEAMRQRLLDPAVWPRIPELYTKFSDVIVTDFTLEQITHLSCLLKKIASDSVLQEGVRPEWTSPGPNSSLLWDQNKLLTRLKELNLIP